MNELYNPYKGLPDGEASKATAVLRTEDLALLRGLYPHKGCIQTIINMLLHDLVEELKHKNILYYKPENVKELENLVIKRCPFAGLAGKANESNDSRRTSTPRQ